MVSTAFRVSDDRNPGNVVSNPEPVFSGLYSYHIPTNTWNLLWDDTSPGGPRIKSRVGHSMLFHPVSIRDIVLLVFISSYKISWM